MAHQRWSRSAVLCGLLIGLVVAGCQSLQSGGSADARASAAEAASDRETVYITQPRDSNYTVQAASFDTVYVRPERRSPAEAARPVEVMVQGAFPDACTQLHAVDQRRQGSRVNVELQMRRQESSVCLDARRPYRFFLTLEGRYTPGEYVLTLNGRSYPFEVPAQAG